MADELKDFGSMVEPGTIIEDKKYKLELEALFNEQQRNEGLKKNFHIVFICLIWLAFAAVCIIFGTRVFHLIAPSRCCWLDDNHIQGIDKLLFSGTLGGFLGKYFNKVIN